jgi:hypothetical protein
VKLAACRLLDRLPLTGIWYRAIRLKFWDSLLATTHTATIPGRFNAGNSERPGFEVLYLAEDHRVVMFEIEALLGSSYPGSPYAANPASDWAVVHAKVQLNRIADLTLPSERRKLQTTAQELTGDWRGYSLRESQSRAGPPYDIVAPTQKLGQALHEVEDLEGFVTYSARVPTHKNLVVFPRRLYGGSGVDFVNPATGRAHRIPNSD